MYNRFIVQSVNDIKDRIRLSEEIGKFVKLKKKGNSFWGLCPFHGEKTPSFSVNDHKSFFYCFGCGMGGDIFAFLQKYKNISFQESIRILSEQTGIKVKNLTEEKLENRILSLLDKTKDFYKSNIQKANSYLKSRNINEESIKRFELGFAPENAVIKFLLNNRFSLQEISAAGIYSMNKDRFRNRLIFPIKDRSGKTIAFGGRTIHDENPKYLNSSETETFKKSFHLFGQQFLEYKQPIIIVEGYLDVIALSQIGIKNVVAIMGTNLSKENAYSLFKITDVIFLMFDGDESGMKAIEKNLNNIFHTLQPNRQILICKLKNEDPYDAAQKGLIYVKTILRQSILLSQWIKETWITSIKNPEEYAVVLSKLSSIIDNINNPFVKTAYEKEFKNFKPKSIVRKVKFSHEEEIMAAIFILWPFWDQIFEEILTYSFANSTFEYIKNFIIECLINGETPSIINEKILQQWTSLKLTLIKKTGLIYMKEEIILNYFINNLIRR